MNSGRELAGDGLDAEQASEGEGGNEGEDEEWEDGFFGSEVPHDAGGHGRECREGPLDPWIVNHPSDQEWAGEGSDC